MEIVLSLEESDLLIKGNREITKMRAKSKNMDFSKWCLFKK